MATKEIPDLSFNSSHLAAGNIHYIESIYDEYIQEKNRIQDSWAAYFSNLRQGMDGEIPYRQVENDIHCLLERLPSSITVPHQRQARIDSLIHAYRAYGHRNARSNPIEYKSINDAMELALNKYDLREEDLETVYDVSTTKFGENKMSLKLLLTKLNKTYCSSIGTEFMYIGDRTKKEWIAEKLEQDQGNYGLEDDDKLRILGRLIAAEGLEHSLATKYPGTKRFGLEGGEALIPMMDALVHASGRVGAKEVVIGMAHRGRLNVLVNILGKNPVTLFEEFEGKFRFGNKDFCG